MDIFVEQMVKRKKTGGDYAKVALCIFGTVIVILLTLLFSGMPYIGSIIFIIGAGLVYLIYNVTISINLEYEYCFTNGALDVDKIIAARRRKRLTDINARDIEMMGTTQNRAFAGYMNDRSIKKIYACTSVNDEGVYFVLSNKSGEKQLLLFSPNDTIKDGFHRLNPQKVFLED